MLTEGFIAIEGRLGANYKPLDVVLSRGAGGHVWDTDGNRYLDCLTWSNAGDANSSMPPPWRKPAPSTA
jgi:acetylornithine/succinyldiaminopimelate/putrescine aminotransferase